MNQNLYFVNHCVTQIILSSTVKSIFWLDLNVLVTVVFERANGCHFLLAQIKKFNGNISKTANFIGMDRTALHRKMKDLNIMPNERYRNIIGY